MEKQRLKIENIKQLTHNVLQFTLENPNDLEFEPGQATRLAVDKEGWRDKAHPFTFTSLPSEDHLEFVIKIYPEHQGVTNELSKLDIGDYLILQHIFGTIHYEGEGVFIAGGAGVTPFIAILRQLNMEKELGNNKLIFANDKEKDIILHEEFDDLLGDNFYNILSQEDKAGYGYGYIDEEYLKGKVDPAKDYFYICGPQPMMKAVKSALEKLGVKEDKIIIEDFSKMKR